MSRLNQTETYIQTEHDNKITEVIKDFSVREKKVVIADFDSLLYTASWTGKNELGEKNLEYTEEEYEIAEGVLSEKIMQILIEVEEYYDIEKMYICVKGKNNFRQHLYKEYKANRPPSLPIIKHLCQYLIYNYGAIESTNCESDDYVYTMSEMIGHSGIILSIDKDLRQIPSIIYNYNTKIWSRVEEEEAKYNFVIQMLIGDAGDNVNLTPGFGIAKAKKIVKQGMSDYQYLKQILKVYKSIHKEKAKEMMLLSYNLLKLHNINNLPLLIK